MQAVARALANPTETSRPVFTSCGLSCEYRQASEFQRSCHHAEIEINFLVAGSLTYLLGSKKITIEPGKLCLFWAASSHQVFDYSQDASGFVATIPLEKFLQWRLPENFVHPIMRSQFIFEPGDDLAIRDTQLFENWAKDLKERHSSADKPVLLEMQARLTRLALSFLEHNKENKTEKHLSTVTDTALNKVVQMAAFIANNYTKKLTVKQIGDHVKLHPNYAMNLFQKTFGSTLMNYLSQHRISHAQRLLTTTHLSVVDVALQSGFLSISRFNEVFSRKCHCSPREYRKTHNS